MPSLTYRFSAAAAFALAALTCQILVWLFVDIDRDVPAWSVFWLQCTVVPLAGALGAICWSPQAIKPREGVWRGWGVMFLFICASASIVATALGDLGSAADWSIGFVAAFGLLVRVLGAAMLFTFGLAGYLLSDETTDLKSTRLQIATRSANDSRFGLPAAGSSSEERLDV